LEHFEPTGTTFSSKTCELTKSELDRVFVTKSAYNRAEVGLVDSAGSDVSDHAALFAELVPAVPVAQTGSETAFTWRNISLFAVVAIATVVGLASAIASGSGSGSGAASGEG
jgi:hypothetical protein